MNHYPELGPRGTTRVVTQEALQADLHSLGLRPGMLLLLHSALSQIGWIAGGPIAVIQALEAVLGHQGTLVMPTHSGDLSDPADWQNPPVPASWWHLIREHTPAYAPQHTPTWQMGTIVDCFRSMPGVLRSSHPQLSFAARGPLAARITVGHPLSPALGDDSPLGKIYRYDGYVLLLGVGHDNNTSLHLAECRATYPGKQHRRCGAPLMRDGKRRWVEYEDIDYDSQDFPALGAAFAAETGLQRSGPAGEGKAMLMRQRPLVDFGVRWLEQNRRPQQPES